jgi:signal transduction histidine kinase
MIGHFKNSIAFRFSLFVFLISLFFGICFSSFEIYQTFQENKELAAHSIEQIEESHIPFLVASLWLTHRELIQDQLNAIAKFNYIAGVGLKDDDGFHFHAGSVDHNEMPKYKTRELIYNYKNTDIKVGDLTIFIDYKKIREDTVKREISTFILFCLQAIFTAIIISFVFRKMVGQHLEQFSDFLVRYTKKPFKTVFALDRNKLRKDELSSVVDSFNVLIDSLNSHMNEQERLIGQLDSNRQALAISNKELEHFAYVASHDLREPLRKISSFTELFAKKYKGSLDEKADTYIYYIVDASKRMQELIDSLLRFSRIQRAELKPESIDLNGMIDEIISDIELSIEEAGALVKVNQLPQIYGNPKLIHILFQNLIANAIKFRGEKPPEVEIDAIEEDEKWHFTIADNGIGLDAKFFDRIFQIFQRLHTREEFSGSGIGLSICKKVVERHGGEIWVESEVGNGTVFHFTLAQTILKENKEETQGNEPIIKTMNP